MTAGGWERVAFVVARGRLDEIAAALASGDPDALARIAAAAWAERQARRALGVAACADERAALALLVDGEPAATALAVAPALVRRAMALGALAAAQRRVALVRLGAPALLVDNLGRAVAAAVAALDPAAPMPDEPPPDLPGLDDGGVHPHGWLEQVLEHSHDPSSRTCARCDRPAADALDDLAGMRPGLDTTAYSVEPSRTVWCPPEVVLPRALDAGRVVAGVAGGPVTFALAGDVPGDGLDPELAARVRALGPDDALVAFLWRDTGIDVAWGER